MRTKPRQYAAMLVMVAVFVPTFIAGVWLMSSLFDPAAATVVQVADLALPILAGGVLAEVVTDRIFGR